MVVGDMRSVFPLGELVFLTGPQGIKDQSSQQVLVLPVSEFKLGLRARGVPFFRAVHAHGWVGQSKHRSCMVSCRSSAAV